MGEVNYNKIKEYKLFQGLTAEELKSVSDIVTRKELEADSIIIREGDTGEQLFLLEEGVVEIFRTLTIVTSKHDFGTKERSFIRLSAEDHCYFGELALFGNRERSATVKAITRCKILMIEADDFLRLCEKNPRIGYVVITVIALILSNYLRKTNDDVVKLTTALSLALSG